MGTTSESIIKPSTIIPVTTSGVEPNCGSRSGSISVVGPPKSGSIQGSIINEAGVPIAATNVATEPVVTNEGAGSNPVTAVAETSASSAVAGSNPVTADKSGTSENPIPGAAAAQATATSTESKGEIGTWTSSTEVCPWEDEE